MTLPSGLGSMVRPSSASASSTDSRSRRPSDDKNGSRVGFGFSPPVSPPFAIPSRDGSRPAEPDTSPPGGGSARARIVATAPTSSSAPVAAVLRKVRSLYRRIVYDDRPTQRRCATSRGGRRIPRPARGMDRCVACTGRSPPHLENPDFLLRVAEAPRVAVRERGDGAIL